MALRAPDPARRRSARFPRPGDSPGARGAEGAKPAPRVPQGAVCDQPADAAPPHAPALRALPPGAPARTLLSASRGRGLPPRTPLANGRPPPRGAPGAEASSLPFRRALKRVKRSRRRLARQAPLLSARRLDALSSLSAACPGAASSFSLGVSGYVELASGGRSACLPRRRSARQNLLRNRVLSAKPPLARVLQAAVWQTCS